MKALLTGITGQDGSFLAESLVSKGCEVYGLVRRLSVPNVDNISPSSTRSIFWRETSWTNLR